MYSIQSKFLNKMILIVFISIGLWSLVWIQDGYFAFKAESEIMRTEYIKSQKNILRKEVTSTVRYINDMRSVYRRTLEVQLKNRVYEAHAIAMNIYQKNRSSKNLLEIKEMIKDALRPIRFNEGRGYYFAVSMEGVEQLYPVNTQFEGQNVIDLQDSAGHFVIQDEIDVIKKKKEGYVHATWVKPDKDNSIMYPKISFVKYFKPLNWYFGTGDYLDNLETKIKKEVLTRIVDLKFEARGYFFGSTYQGDPLFSNGKITMGSSSIWTLTDPNGVKIIQEQRKAIENPEGGFVYYSWSKLDSSVPSPKMSFIQCVPKWEWMIGAGIYLDTIEKTILEQETALIFGLKKRIIRSILILGGLLCFVFFWSKRISNQIQASVDTFSSFLKRASVGSIIIDPNDIQLKEFRDIAMSMNTMLMDRKKVRIALEESEEKYRSIFENASEGFYQSTPEGRFIKVNQAFSKMLGYESPEEFISTITDIADLYYVEKEDRHKLVKLLRTTGSVKHIESKVQCKNRSHIWALESARVIYDQNGNIARYEGNVIDITERKHAEKKLMYRNRMEAAMAKVSRQFAFLDNVDYSTILQIMGESVSANRAYLFEIKNDVRKISNTVEWCDYGTNSQIDILQNLEVSTFPWWMKQLHDRKNIVINNVNNLPCEAFAEQKILQEQKILSLIVVPIWSRKNNLMGFMGYDDTKRTRNWSDFEIKTLQVVGEMIASDLDRKASDDKIAYFARIFEESLNEIYLFDPDTLECIQVNRAAQNNLGYTMGELEKLSVLDFKPEFTSQSFAKKIIPLIEGKEEKIVFETIHKRKDQSFYNVEVHLQLLQYENKLLFVAIGLDITERKKLEAQILHNQKIESIGTLAGGIAHDFNNILFPIVGHTEMLLEDVTEDSSFHESLNSIYKASLRAKELVNQILTFSRQDNSEIKIFKIEPVIQEAVELIRATIPKTISIHLDITGDCSVIKADPTQIYQIVMNLATNAYHAMETFGGELTISLNEIQLGENETIIPDITPGNYACLTVIDTGIGIKKDIIEKVFDPFFTTKEPGKGSGMGLSVVHGILKSIGGNIHINSEQGIGTTICVYLPVARTSYKEPKALIEEFIQGGNERILLVDDEKSIIAMEKRMLERLGYHVVTCTNSIEALSIFRSSPDTFDLVITDMAMPFMSGERLSAELTEIRSDIPILLCTGFSETMSKEKAYSLGIKGFLLKPIVMKEFARKLREVLDVNSHRGLSTKPLEADTGNL